MKMPFDKSNSDDGISSVFTPLLDALFLMLVAIFAGYIIEVKSKIPEPIELSTDQYFLSGEAELSPENKENLKQILETDLGEEIESIKREGGIDQLLSINIEGHADAIPLRDNNTNFESNEDLSYYRALNIYKVVQALNSELEWGIQDSLFLVSGYGKRRLKIDTQEEEERNRRIVIRFIFDKINE